MKYGKNKEENQMIRFPSEMFSIHKSIYDYIKSDYPEINIKLRKSGCFYFILMVKK